MFNTGIPSEQKVRIREVDGLTRYFRNGVDITETVELELKNKQLEELLPRYTELFGVGGEFIITPDNLADSCFLSYDPGKTAYDVLVKGRSGESIDPKHELGFYPWMLALSPDDFNVMCEVIKDIPDNIPLGETYPEYFLGLLHRYLQFESLIEDSFTDFIYEYEKDCIFFKAPDRMVRLLDSKELKNSLEKGRLIGHNRIEINALSGSAVIEALNKLSELWFIDVDTDELVKVNLSDPVFQDNLYLDGDYFVTQVSKYKVKRIPIHKNPSCTTIPISEPHVVEPKPLEHLITDMSGAFTIGDFEPGARYIHTYESSDDS